MVEPDERGYDQIVHLRDEIEIEERDHVVEVEVAGERTVRVGYGGVTE